MSQSNKGLKMKQTIGLSQFTDAFMSIRPNNFSYEGLVLLFDWIEQQESETGEQQELDVIALCCDFIECTYEDVVNDYRLADDMVEGEVLTSENIPQSVIDYLNEQTVVIGYTDETIIYLNF
jgi:hypothetical protein